MRRALFLTLIAACTGHLADGRFQTGSATLTTSADRRAVFVVNEDEGTLSRVTTGDSQVDQVYLGARPSRVARAGDHLYVSLRGERAVVVLSADRRLTEVDRIQVGPEPVGVVASEDGSRVYVAVSLGGRVVEIDTDDRTISRSWPVEGEPRWLALDPADTHLWVGTAVANGLHRIDLVSTSDSRASSHQPIGGRAEAASSATR